MKIVSNNSGRTVTFRPLKPKIAVPSQIQLILASLLQSFAICHYFKVNLTWLIISILLNVTNSHVSYCFNLIRSS